MKLSAVIVVVPVFVLILVTEARIIDSPYWQLTDNPSAPLPQTDLFGDHWSENESTLPKPSFLEIVDTLKRSYPSKPGTVKRSSLNELIQRLMALRGELGEPGRAAVIRFGAGRR